MCSKAPLHFVYLAFCQRVTLSMGHIVNAPFWQIIVLSFCKLWVQCYKTFNGVVRKLECLSLASLSSLVRPEPTQVKHLSRPYPQTLDKTGKACQGQIIYSLLRTLINYERKKFYNHTYS
jgi:hypothetical protein